MVLLGFSLVYDGEVITSHPQVVEAFCMCKGKSRTRQVLVTLHGAPITTLNLGNWGSYKLRTYVPEPLKYFMCQKYGHYQANSIKVHKECQRSQVRQEASHLACSFRKQEIHRRQELAKKCPGFVLVPPSTYVWGQYKRERTPRPSKKETLSSPKEFPRFACDRQTNHSFKDHCKVLPSRRHSSL